jgi:peroxiredoxin
MKTLVIMCLALSFAFTAAGAQERARSSNVKARRADARAPDPFSRSRINGHVMVGDPAPDFDLTSSAGGDVVLSRLRGEWLLLRFADDRQELANLGGMKDDLDRIGVRMVAICGDKPQTLHAFVERRALPYEILSDATGEVSAIYGFYDPATLSGRTGLVIVDRRGIVRMALQGGAPADQVVELARFTVSAFQPQP